MVEIQASSDYLSIISCLKTFRFIWLPIIISRKIGEKTGFLKPTQAMSSKGNVRQECNYELDHITLNIH